MRCNCCPVNPPWSSCCISAMRSQLSLTAIAVVGIGFGFAILSSRTGSLAAAAKQLTQQTTTPNSQTGLLPRQIIAENHPAYQIQTPTRGSAYRISEPLGGGF